MKRRIVTSLDQRLTDSSDPRFRSLATGKAMEEARRLIGYIIQFAINPDYRPELAAEHDGMYSFFLSGDHSIGKLVRKASIVVCKIQPFESCGMPAGQYTQLIASIEFRKGKQWIKTLDLFIDSCGRGSYGGWILPSELPKQKKEAAERESLPSRQQRDPGYWLARSCADADARTYTAQDAEYAEAGQEPWHP